MWNLENLNLAHNNFNGSIPASWGHLLNLKHLYFFDAVVVARYLKAILVIPDIRRSNTGDKRFDIEKESLSSYFTACGLINKPKTEIVNIDADNVNNDLAVVEYIYDMYTYYRSLFMC
ncbi:hypothetical protein CASFOL_028467 [Castilleja foliolosa]|uniref:Uncharacterized protein n=1 Tax=Castilleja foliolosa TaxID=1961234 RepID=A0ABD3CBZ9_9LAMI